MRNKLETQILKDLTQKTYEDCEKVIFRTASLLENNGDKFSLIISVAVNLINHSLDTIDKEKMGAHAYHTLLNNIKSCIDNLPQDFQHKAN